MSPIYEYHCQGCGNNFEKIRPYRGRDLVSCLNCGAKVDRKISIFSFKFFNPFTKDGEGFTSKYVRNEELAEMNQECRER